MPIYGFFVGVGSKGGTSLGCRAEFRNPMHFHLSYDTPFELRHTLLSYSAPSWAVPHTSELRRTRCAAPFGATSLPTDLRRTLLSCTAPFWKFWAPPHRLIYATHYWAAPHLSELRRTLNWLYCSLVLPLRNNYFMNTWYNNNERLQFITFTFVSKCSLRILKLDRHIIYILSVFNST